MSRPSNAELDQVAQELLSDEEFREWITQIDFPSPGDDSNMPMLFVGARENYGGPLHLTMIAIADDAWNNQRFAIMRALGDRCFDEGIKPVAVALISETWCRDFTPEEERARGNRQIADYEDREEWVMLCGTTVDGRSAIIRAPILRDADAVITGYGPRQSSFENDEMHVTPTLLRQFFQSYFAKMLNAAPHSRRTPSCS